MRSVMSSEIALPKKFRLNGGVIINRCISNNPKYRYPDVQKLISDVWKLAHGELQHQAYWPLRVRQIREQREIERSLNNADEVKVHLEEILTRDEERSVNGLTVLWIKLTRDTARHFVLKDTLELADNTILIISGKGVLDADISGPETSVVVLRDYAALNNLSVEPPPKNDLTYVMVGPGSYLNFVDVTSKDYRRFFPGRRRILRDLDATTSFRFGGPSAFADEERDVLDAIEQSAMPDSYKGVLRRFFSGEDFTVMP